MCISQRQQRKLTGGDSQTYPVELCTQLTSNFGHSAAAITVGRSLGNLVSFWASWAWKAAWDSLLFAEVGWGSVIRIQIHTRRTQKPHLMKAPTLCLGLQILADAWKVTQSRIRNAASLPLIFAASVSPGIALDFTDDVSDDTRGNHA